MVQIIGSAFSVGIWSGCLNSSNSGPDSGDLEIENNDSDNHSVTVVTKKVSENSDDSYSDFVTRTPESTPIWKRNNTFEIDSEETFRRNEYLSEPGAYFVRVKLETGTSAQGWIGLYESANGGVAEQYIAISIDKGGSLTVFAPQSGV